MIYKDCDIRGIYGKELTLQEVRLIGRALGTMLEGRNITVCGDVRVSTYDIKEQLIAGLVETGGDVIDIGIVPTPAAYFAKSSRCLDTYALAVVTASHNPAEYNGIKLMLGNMPPTPQEIKDIAEMVRTGNFSFSEGRAVTLDIRDAYEKTLWDLAKPAGKPLKVVLDIGNGTTSGIAGKIFSDMGYAVSELYPEADGRFPNRNPNPADFKNIEELCRRVTEENADFGAAFDGDGDRAVFVDDKGRPVINEKSLIMLTALKSRRYGGPFSVVYDQKCSSIVPKTIESLGGEPILERSGHAFIKKRFIEKGSILAGEISGHFFFKELGHDDGIYAGLCIGEYISESGKKLSELADEIPDPHISSDLRYKVEYAAMDQIIERIKSDYAKYPVSVYDGVRVELPDGWFLVRKSVTAQEMTLRIEADSDRKVEEMRRKLVSRYFAQ